jgi:hypothetical protein
METNADAEIQANFPTVFLCNFTHDPTVDTQFGTAGPYEIAWLSDMYTAYGGNLPDLYVAFARQLGAPNLILARNAFGPGLDYYVGEFAPAAVVVAYDAALNHKASAQLARARNGSSRAGGSRANRASSWVGLWAASRR